MRRREFITSLVSTITAWPFAGLAQAASKVYRIGILSTDKPLPEPIFGAIVRALASHGYMPDRNVVLELRASGDQWEQLPQLAKDLVASNVDVILTFSFPAAMAAKNATFKKVFDAQMAFRKEGVLWGRVAENTYDNFMARQSAANKL